MTNMYTEEHTAAKDQMDTRDYAVIRKQMETEEIAVNRTFMYEQVSFFVRYLQQEEKSEATCRQYRRDILAFLESVSEPEVKKITLLSYKQKLMKRYRPVSMNTKIAALNQFLSFLGLEQLKLRQLKIQKKTFCDPKKELTRGEYGKLLQTARKQGDRRLLAILQTITGTGIRVSELSFITAEAVRKGAADIHLKGKNRQILIGRKLQKILLDYMKQEKIRSGPLFVSRNQIPLDRSNIWKMMKHLSYAANVPAGKVFPHNLRHLFARCFYETEKDLVKLADILGHSNVNTTRIYMMTTGREHRQKIDALNLTLSDFI